LIISAGTKYFLAESHDHLSTQLNANVAHTLLDSSVDDL